MKNYILCLLILSNFILQAQNNQEIITNHISKVYPEINFNNDLVITDESYSKLTEAHHVYLNQTINGIEIYNSGGNFAIKNDKVVYSNFELIKSALSKINTGDFNISAHKAIVYACNEIGIRDGFKTELIKSENSMSYLFDKGTISLENIPVKLIYYYTSKENQPIHLAWDLSIYEKSKKHWWSIRVDATDGTILDINDWVLECTFGDSNHQGHGHQRRSFYNHEASSLLPPTDAYNVFAIPVESPSHGARTIVNGTDNLLASPFGWHDDDGAAGHEYTITRGNNVYAYEDQDDNDNPGYSPNGGGLLNFDFPLDLSIAPDNNLDPAITNLFYMNNIMHDVWYQYGFDESSGNFQENNYGNGGNGSDYVYAEAQDGGGTNNANFATPGDGANPRMQMFLWSAPSADNNLLQLNSPSSLAGPYTAMQGAFGPAVPTTPLTADFALVDDDSGDNEDACEPLTNGPTLNGKIAIIRRGTCTFVSKVQAAEAEGAVAVIMVNNVGGAPITMGGNDPGIGIPSVMISQADGEAIISALLASTAINGTLQSSGNLVELDGDFDNGIVAHEYGHGISNRLTGGASNSNCLSNDEQMGEGWSDWFGLMLTIEPGDIGTDIRGIGTYAIGEPTNGNGIRPAPYSTDLGVNNFTYDATNNTGAISQPHGIGFVWCTMLWDLTWALIDIYGYDTDMYNGSGGNNIAMSLVVEALKLQSCNPGFVDGRDAILQADQILYNGDHECLIWQVFAARGLGFSADQGSANSRTDQTEAFDLPAACQLPTMPPVASFSYLAECTGEVIFSDLSTNNPDSWSWDFGDGNSSNLENPTHVYVTSGTYTVELTSSNGIGSGTETIIVMIELPDAPTASNVDICENQEASFTGSGSGTLMWYDDSGTTLLETGNTFVTPPLNTTTNYLVQNVLQNVDYVGPANGSIGSGNAHSQPAVFTLNFEAFTSFDIVSVWVNANSTGNRTINLYSTVDGGGLIIDQVTVNITSTGPQRITLNLTVPSAGTFSIGGVNMDLYRNNGGVNYPYSLPSIVDIISSSAGPNYYYYYYDWEIHTSPCLSPFTPVVANVNPSSFGTDVQSACGSYTWIDGNTYTSSNGNATYTLQNANGCDSIVTLDLTIHDPSIGTDIQSACNSYTWIDGNTYTSSNNTATHILQNVNGCDSTVTLNLTINGTVSSTDTQTACESYTWIDGNTYTQSNNTATFTLIASQGCDSVVTLDLSINNPDFVTDAQVSCDSYTWIDGNTYTQSNNTASMTFQNQNGCDSTVTLDLTINTVNNTILQLDPSTAQAEASNATYQWLDCENGFVEFAGETSQTFQCQGACYFEVAVLVTENGCSDTSDCVILNVLDLNNNTSQESVTVYPNPTDNALNINGLHTLAEIRAIDVTDYNGRLVKSLDQIITIIDVSNLADGIYFLNIHHEDGVEVKKFIIE